METSQRDTLDYNRIQVLTLNHIIPPLKTLKKKSFENIEGNQHFLLFPQCFLPFPGQISTFQSHLFCCLQMLSIWTSVKNLLFGKELSSMDNNGV